VQAEGCEQCREASIPKQAERNLQRSFMCDCTLLKHRFAFVHGQCVRGRHNRTTIREQPRLCRAQTCEKRRGTAFDRSSYEQVRATHSFSFTITLYEACVHMLRWTTPYAEDMAVITLSASVYRSSIGEFWSQHVRQAAMKLKKNAYVHWYERAGCAREELVGALNLMHDTALSYEWCFR
jgi:hypothetical protein